MNTILGRERVGALEPTSGDNPGRVVDGQAFYAASDVRSLGPALFWAMANGGTEGLQIIADPEIAPILARRATLIDPNTKVWTLDGELRASAVAEPEAPPQLPPDHWAFAAVLSEAGARPVDDHGMLIGEIAGLEVARVVDPPDLPDFSDPDDSAGVGGPKLEIGVGQADRELQEYIHGHLNDDENLRRAIAAVVRHRRPGSGSHPLTRLGRQRWLRSVLLDEPSLIGASELEPVVPLRPRQHLLGTEPAAASGDVGVVVCSVGVDLDLVPEAVDYRARVDPGAELLIVIPERDRLPIVVSMVERLDNARLVSIDVPWAVHS